MPQDEGPEKYGKLCKMLVDNGCARMDDDGKIVFIENLKTSKGGWNEMTVLQKIQQNDSLNCYTIIPGMIPCIHEKGDEPVYLTDRYHRIRLNEIIRKHFGICNTEQMKGILKNIALSEDYNRAKEVFIKAYEEHKDEILKDPDNFRYAEKCIEETFNCRPFINNKNEWAYKAGSITPWANICERAFTNRPIKIDLGVFLWGEAKSGKNEFAEEHCLIDLMHEYKVLSANDMVDKFMQAHVASKTVLMLDEVHHKEKTTSDKKLLTGMSEFMSKSKLDGDAKNGDPTTTIARYTVFMSGNSIPKVFKDDAYFRRFFILRVEPSEYFTGIKDDTYIQKNKSRILAETYYRIFVSKDKEWGYYNRYTKWSDKLMALNRMEHLGATKEDINILDAAKKKAMYGEVDEHITVSLTDIKDELGNEVNNGNYSHMAIKRIVEDNGWKKHNKRIKRLSGKREWVWVKPK